MNAQGEWGIKWGVKSHTHHISLSMHDYMAETRCRQRAPMKLLTASHKAAIGSIKINDLAINPSHGTALQFTQSRNQMGDQMGDHSKNKLNARAVSTAGDGKLFDGGGLMLVKKTGRGQWIYRYSHLSKRREMGLGALSDVTLAEARKIRDKWASALANGQDPISVRAEADEDAKSAAAQDNPTFEEIARTVFEAKKAGLRGDGQRGRWLSPLEVHIFPAIGRKPIRDIGRVDIRDALKPIWKSKHPTAIKTIIRIRLIFDGAAKMGIDCDPNIVDSARYMLGEVRHVAQHVPATDWRIMPELYAGLSSRDTASARCLRFMILTAVRSNGARHAQFSEIEGDVWTVPADRVKGREGRVSDFLAPLSAEAQTVANECAMYSTDFLFPSHRGGKGISDVAIAKELRLHDTTGRPHGFRASFRTWVQEATEVPRDIAEMALDHVIGSEVERAYARSTLIEKRRNLMETWAQFVTGQTQANIININSQKNGDL